MAITPYDTPDDSVSSAPTSAAPSSSKKTQSKGAKAVGAAGQELNQASVSRLNSLADHAIERSSGPAIQPKMMDVPSYRKGGKIRKSGAARLHKGERMRGGYR